MKYTFLALLIFQILCGPNKKTTSTPTTNQFKLSIYDSGEIFSVTPDTLITVYDSAKAIRYLVKDMLDRNAEHNQLMQVIFAYENVMRELSRDTVDQKKLKQAVNKVIAANKQYYANRKR